jgi:hypothetical protein
MGKPWFRVKRYGVGAGLPCSWEGWLASAALLGAIIAIRVLGGDHAGWQIPAILILVAVFVVVARLKSDAPWKWRWGRE